MKQGICSFLFSFLIALFLRPMRGSDGRHSRGALEVKKSVFSKASKGMGKWVLSKFGLFFNQEALICLPRIFLLVAVFMAILNALRWVVELSMRRWCFSFSV